LFVAVASLLALLVAIALSCFTPINIGFLSIALAFLVGHVMGGMTISKIISGFPVSLFLTLTGITLLFSQAKVNGTLEKMAHYSVRLARGNRGMIPIIFFFLAFGLASIGAGNIAATALLAPVAMSIAGEIGMSPFLMAMMLANGASAGAFSPFSPTGIIAIDLMDRVGLEGFRWANYVNTFAAQSFVAFSGYFVLGGAKYFTRTATTDIKARIESLHSKPIPPLTRDQRWTLGVIVALVVVVVSGQILSRMVDGWALQIDVGMGAFTGAMILSLRRAADEESAIKAIPWGVILMVSGVTVLIGVLDKTGGMDIFSTMLARLSGPKYVNGMIAFVTGVISAYSSSSGVVMPAFLPTIPGLIEKLGGGNPLMIAYSINVGAHLVDVSPLSTLGALCLGCAPASADYSDLFRKLMAWGLSMAIVGAIVCQLFFGYR